MTIKDLNDIRDQDIARKILTRIVNRARSKSGMTAPSPNTGWPLPVSAADLLANRPPRPPDLIQGMLTKGCKAFLAAPSKARKTWFQLHLALCISHGIPWFGHAVEQGRVVYVNTELQPWGIAERIDAVRKKMQIYSPSENLILLNLVGHQITIEKLEAELRLRCRGDVQMIIIDPLYKLLGDRSENDASDMADLLGRIEAIAHSCGAAMFIAHHFAKGNASEKEVIDRAAGSGTIGRDADLIITLTPHSEEDCFTADFIARYFTPVDSCVLRWSFPMFTMDSQANPHALKKPGHTVITLSNDEVCACLGRDWYNAKLLESDLRQKYGCSEREATAAVRRVIAAGLAVQQGGRGQKLEVALR